MLGWDRWFWGRPQPLDRTVETVDHDIGRLLEEVYSHDYLCEELWHHFLQSQPENLTMFNGHGVAELSRGYRVNSDTSTYGESGSPNQSCQGNPQLDIRGNWPGMSASAIASVECEHEHRVTIDSLVDLHEHGSDTDGPRIVCNTTALELQVELKR
jgi:hypothetical protein